jgi:hypothetical protein
MKIYFNSYVLINKKIKKFVKITKILQLKIDIFKNRNKFINF